MEEYSLDESLSEILKRAEGGDVLAAKDALLHLSYALSIDYIPSFMDSALPVPDYVRKYLSKCLYRMAMGEDANRAMNIKKAGPKKWAHHEKLVAADCIYQLVWQDCPILDAALNIADYINDEIIKEMENNKTLTPGTPEWIKTYHPGWRGFLGRKVSAELLTTWYYEMRAELTERRKKGRDTQTEN